MYKIVSVVKKPGIQFLSLTLLALIIHAIVLKFIFPGYYSPLYPHHSDFYISVALAHSPGVFFQYRYLGHSRPIGILVLKIIGFWGLHGAILFTVINVAVNSALSATLARRILKVEYNRHFVLMFCIYCYLLFSQSYFYTFYTQDVLSHLSFFFLIAGASCCYQFHERFKILAYSTLFCCSVIAFLCKETYALSALVFALLWFLYYKGRSSAKALTPIVTIAAALILVGVIDLLIKSIFINFASTPKDPYYINLRPASVLKEIYLYATEGLNPLEWGMVATCGLLIAFYFRRGDKKDRYLLWGCLLAAFFSWVPNSLIPNHHHGGYSFNGAYLLYLPVIFIPILLWRQKVFIRSLVVTLSIAALISPLFSQKEYARQWWILEQETSQRNILHALDTLMGGLRPGKIQQSILITGLTMPFYPFHHPLALKDYPNAGSATYDVVNYSLTGVSEREDLVKFIKPADVRFGQYSDVWMFAGDGRLIGRLAVDSARVRTITDNNCLNSIIYPDSTKNQELLSLLKSN